MDTFKRVNTDRKMSRGEFLAILGGMALTLVLYKVGSFKDIFTTVSTRKKPIIAREPDTYGNNVYGGKRA